jgi:outer membrane protein assembly factor BamB
MQSREVAMRALLNTGWVLLMAVALALALAGCGAEANSSLQQPAPALGAGFDLPAPSSLRIASDAQIKLSGKDYHAAWAHNRVAVAGNNARYSPQYASDNRTLSDAAYAIYAVDVSSFTGSAKLFLSFETAGQHGDAWVGLADYPHDRWDWEKMSGPVDKQGQLLFDLAGKSSAGVMPVALVFIGTDVWELASLYLGDAPEPGAWPMAGQNIQHTCRATDPGAQSSKVQWKYHTSGPGTTIRCMATGPDNTLYVGAGDGLFAFDPQGKLLWECYGVTPKAAPTVGSDGNIYVGGVWPNAGLHVIGSDGKRKLAYWTDFDVAKSPVLLPNGTICFVTADNQLRCIHSNGNPKWEYDLIVAESSPAVDANGVIYIGEMDSELVNSTGSLDAINPDGTLKWAITLSGACRTKPQIGPDGTIYFIDWVDRVPPYAGNLCAVSPDGEALWNKSGANAYTAPAIDAAGNIYVCGTSVVAYDPDGVQLCSAPLTGMATGGPGLSPDGKTISISTDTGQIAMFDANGTPLVNVETGGEFWVGSVAGDGVGYYASTDNYISAYNRDSSMRWHDGVGGRVLSSPVTSMDGTVYFGSEDRSLYAMWPDGRLKWRYLTDGAITASPLVLPDGTVLVGSKDHKLHAVSPEGAALWQYETGDAIEGSPALGPDGKIYFGSNDRSIYALNQDGTLAWSFATDWNVTGAPTVDTDGKVYFSSWDSNIYCLNPDGTLDWSFLCKGPVKGGVALSGDILYAVCEKDSYTGRIVALNKDGTQAWWYNTGGQASMSPTVGEDGTVYVTTTFGQSDHERAIYAVKNQTLKWHYDTASNASAMALDSDGLLFAGTADGRMLAMDISSGTMVVAWTSSCGPANFFSPAIAGSRTYVGYDTGIYAFGDN